MASLQIEFTCHECGKQATLPATHLIEFQLSENLEDLLCWNCKPIRIKPPTKKLSSKAILSQVNKWVDTWVKEISKGGKHEIH